MTERSLRRPARYLVVGAWNTAFGLVLFTILYLALGSRLGYIGVLALAQAVAVIQSHATQRFFVWKSHGPYWPELLRFSLVYATTFTANLLLLAAAVDGLGFPVLPSQWTIGGALIVVTYFVQRGWTFRDPGAATVRDVDDGAGMPVSDRADRGTS